MAATKCTITHLTPAMGQLLTSHAFAEMPHLRLAFFVGDVLSKVLLFLFILMFPSFCVVFLFFIFTLSFSFFLFLAGCYEITVVGQKRPSN